jgi:phosphohistidine phosphatase
MHIFIMRHGEAANTDTEDSVRPLTKVGIIETTKMGEWLASRKLSPIKVFVSPYLRAQQSCANVIEAISETTINNDVIPETLNLITPSGNARQVHDFIDGFFKDIVFLDNDKTLDDKQGVLFISHMPFVSYFVAELTKSTNMPLFATGTIAIIDYDIKKMHGELVGMVSPENVALNSDGSF